MKVLVTGGAGFIGSHIVDKLIELGHKVTIIDNLTSTSGKKPEYLNPKAKFILGDVKDLNLLQKVLPETEVIFHEAASVGIAQSNYEVDPFVDNNCVGTARLLQAIINLKIKPKLIISASNTTYGEGLYSCEKHGKFHPEIRTQEEINTYGFDPVCPICKGISKPVPTPEETELNCNSIYAYTKKFQEETCLFLGKLYEFPVVLLKYFNVFGPRQSLSNPYTGVSAIFMSRVKNGNNPLVYEDGNQTRDFVSIHDVVEANILAMKKLEANYKVFNVGSGIPTTINDLAREICTLYKKDLKIETTNKFRKGDIRHCISDTTRIKEIGWSPKVGISEGLREIYEWAKNQEAVDHFDKANEELKEKGLI
ncbi:ADP-L-glycero-D-manno-heptose-6-epimerase [uncultured archaeon]|nr:ADP-L-glycero-D-manno-heptose-6-epimerase [uncultured archaeon]